MSDCHSCKYFYEEPDVNFAECKKEAEDKYWSEEEDCPDYECIECEREQDDE